MVAESSRLPSVSKSPRNLPKRECRVPAASAISAASATIRSWRQPSSIVRSSPISEVGLTSSTLRSERVVEEVRVGGEGGVQGRLVGDEADHQVRHLAGLELALVVLGAERADVLAGLARVALEVRPGARFRPPPPGRRGRRRAAPSSRRRSCALRAAGSGRPAAAGRPRCAASPAARSRRARSCRRSRCSGCSCSSPHWPRICGWRSAFFRPAVSELRLPTVWPICSSRVRVCRSVSPRRLTSLSIRSWPSAIRSARFLISASRRSIARLAARSRPATSPRRARATPRRCAARGRSPRWRPRRPPAAPRRSRSTSSAGSSRRAKSEHVDRARRRGRGRR